MVMMLKRKPRELGNEEKLRLRFWGKKGEKSPISHSWLFPAQSSGAEKPKLRPKPCPAGGERDSSPLGPVTGLRTGSGSFHLGFFAGIAGDAACGAPLG